MQEPRAAQTTSARAASSSSAPSTGSAIGERTHAGHSLTQELGLDPAQARDIAIGAGRELRSPLAALRVLLEGTRAGVTITSGFADRALEEIDRAEAAAHDVVAWTMPRSLRSTRATLGEIVQSLKEALSPADRRRTHFVLEQENSTLESDAPLIVEVFERSLRHLYREPGAGDAEVMVHVHASDDDATFSFIQTGGGAMVSDAANGTELPTLADALLRASVARLGGRTSIHDAEGHRCAVITIPLKCATRGQEAGQ